MLERKKHKESGLWLFYVGFNLDIRLKLLGIKRVKGTKWKGKAI